MYTPIHWKKVTVANININNKLNIANKGRTYRLHTLNILIKNRKQCNT